LCTHPGIFQPQAGRAGPDTGIYLMKADGTDIVALTDNDFGETTPVFTLDGQFIVYASEQDGNPDIFRMRPDGSGRTKLARHPEADGHQKVSTDGRLIYFNSNRSSDPTISPDGTQLL